MIAIDVPFENIAYLNRPTFGLSVQGINEDVLEWLAQEGEGDGGLEWRICYGPKRIRIRFKSEKTAMMFKLIWG